MIDIQKADKIYILCGNNDDDLNEWLDKQERVIFEVDEVCKESNLAWIKDCPYAISQDYIEVVLK